MRILNVIMCLDPIAGGGAVERVYQLSRSLALAGQDCAILTTRQAWDEAHVRRLGNVKVVALSYLSERFKIPLGQLQWLRRHLLEYDITHLALNWTVINTLAYVALRRYRRPYVLSSMGWLAIDGRSRLLKRVYRAVIGRRIVRDARLCIAITPREIEDYLSHGVERNRIVLIPNGINPEAFQDANDEEFRSRYGLDLRPFVLFVGRLDPIKGPDLLIRAFDQVANLFPHHQLVIAGNDNGFLSELKQLRASLGLEHKVIFLAHLGGRELSLAYHAAQLFVIPSRYDTMTIVALGAAVSGTPVLLTDRCDFEQLQEAGGGRVVACNVEGLAAGLTELLGDPTRLKEMGERARRFVLDEYRWERICQRFIEAFETAWAGAWPAIYRA